jgi:hypothetical protein
MATEQEIANILAAIADNINRLVKALVENAVFQQTGQIPGNKSAARRQDVKRGPRPRRPHKSRK